MKTLLNPSRISGLVLFGIGLILLSQTFGLDGDFFDDGIHPFAYPRILIYLLLVLAALIVLTGKEKKGKGPGSFPIFNPRSVGIGLVTLLYAALFSTLGFILSSVAASVACGVIMGWGGSLRRWLILAALNVTIISLTWILFWRVLKIPLPYGTIW